MEGRELWQLTDDELLVALRQSQTRLNQEYADQLALLGELSTRNLSMTKGYRSEARLLRDLLRISDVEARRRLVHAVAVTAARPLTGPALPSPLPATAEAVRTGVLNIEHLEVIRRTMSDLPDEIPMAQRQRAERTLVKAASTFDPTAVAKLGRTIRDVLDQDGRRPTEVQLRNPVNELRWVSRPNGELEFNGRLAAEGAALMATVLGPLAKPRPAVDGRPDPRTGAERQGDALVDALRLAANSGDLPTEGGERPTLVITMPLGALREQLPAALPDGAGPIDARMARRMACDSAVIPVVLGARSEPTDVDRKTRVIPTPMRRALVLRDGGCALPRCTIPARWCDAHHRRHRADGDPTSLDNLALLCGVHHDLAHHSDWQIVMRHGRPQFIPPPYIDPDRVPRRNLAHPSAWLDHQNWNTDPRQ